MATSRKVESIAAFQLEAGKQPGANTGWGGSSSAQTLGAGDALAYTEFTPGGKISTFEDDEIDGLGFQDLPVQTGKFAEGSIAGYLRYQGIDALLYWMFGWERPGYSPLTMARFTVSGVTVSPTAGATYTNNSSTFTVKSTSITDGAGYIWAQRTSGTNAPQASGDLTKSGGTGDATIAFSATSGIYYSHLFELDRMDRHLAAYRTSPAEQTASDYNAADRKNRAATLAIKRGPQDHRYKNAMCKRFTLSSQAGGVAKWSADFDAYGEERGDYASANWTFGTGASGSTLLIPHHHFTVSIGPSGSLVDVGVVDWEVSVDIPLQHLQDSESGLFLAEPKFEGKYTVSLKMTLSRHSADTYLAYRDNYTALCAKIVAASGAYGFELFLSELRLSNAAITADNVPNQTLEFVCERDAGTPFTTELAGHGVIQESPVLCQVKNQNSTNEMRRE